MAFISIKTCIPARAIIWLMCFTCTLFLYMIRINLSIIILAMVEPTKGNTTFTPECKQIGNSFDDNLTSEAHTSTESDYGTRYAWNTQLQGLILGAYFWGFSLAGMPAGAIVEKFGAARCITISFVVSSVLTVLAPWTAILHPIVLIISRFFIGLFAAVVFPGLHHLVARWAPPEEKGKFVGALLGGSLGTVITWPVLGAVIENLGWTWAFFGSGAISFLWTIVWWFCVSDSPEEHPRISEQEKNYIVESLSGTISKVKKIPPYISMARSIPFWALLILHFGNLWGLFFLMTAGPNFMSSVLGFNLGHTGILASLPYLARLIFGIIFGQIGDFILKKKLMKKSNIRKSFVLFSHILPGILLFIQTLTGCDVTWAIILITMSLGFNGASTITNLQNSQDLAPNFAGTLYGIINCVGSTTGFINPSIVGSLTAKHNGLHEWHQIFYIGSSVYIASGVIFFIFGTADLQPWNEIESKKEATEGIENIGFDRIEDLKNKNNDNNKI